MSKKHHNFISQSDLWQRKFWIAFVAIVTIFVASHFEDLLKFKSTVQVRPGSSHNNNSNIQKPMDFLATSKNNSISPVLTPFLFYPVPINNAEKELLQTVQGIGPYLAEQIVLTRRHSGCFFSPDDLQKVKGIGGSKANQLKNNQAFSYECTITSH